MAWLEPYPDALIDDAPGLAARYEAKEAVALAFISGLQHLPARQRAVLVLRDVLGFHADETAEMLGISPAAANSALQRARDTLERRLAPRPERLSLPPDGLVARFADAFARDDIDAVVALLTEDAVVSMPPEPEWHQGRAAVDAFLRDRHMRRRGRPWRFVPIAANLQPAYAYYMLHDDGWRRSGLFVVGARADGITSITRFHEGDLLDRFGVPERLEPDVRV